MPLKAMIGGKTVDHGEMFKIANSVKTSHAESMESKAKADFEKQLKEEKKMVRARFILGNKAELWNDIGHCTGPGDPLIQYRFLDGHVYTIPKGLVDKVNREGVTYKRGQRIMPDGSIAGSDEKQVIREFVPAGF